MNAFAWKLGFNVLCQLKNNGDSYLYHVCKKGNDDDGDNDEGEEEVEKCGS